MEPEDVRYLAAFDSFRLPQHLTDVLVIGTGVAGYSAALWAARGGARVMVLAKGEPGESNTAYAQGGIAAVLADAKSRSDSPEAHAADTIRVGHGLCDATVVERVAREAADRVALLQELGAAFDLNEKGVLARGLEGGHSRPRILHARGDATGAEIRDVLANAVTSHKNVTRWGGAFVVDLLSDDDGRCRGALVLSRGHLRCVWASTVVLAAGGYGQIYQETSNYPGACGDGVAAAFRAGCAVRDMEFIQFHPTTLYLAGVPRMLITEAVRGEGAHIVDGNGERFLKDVHEQAELAPRDVLSRSILTRLANPEHGGVFLDLRHLDTEKMTKRFPGVARSCAAHGLDIGEHRIPIRPAAHYTIGGVIADIEGRTAIPGLLACGEVSSTGLHGANRLASNSLLEGLVAGRHAGEHAVRDTRGKNVRPVKIRSDVERPREGRIDVRDLRISLKALTWRDVGIVRNGAELMGAEGAITAWERFAHRVGSEEDTRRLTLLNMLCVARLASKAAHMREESRGTHFRLDYKKRDDKAWLGHIVHVRGEGTRFERMQSADDGSRA